MLVYVRPPKRGRSPYDNCKEAETADHYAPMHQISRSTPSTRACLFLRHPCLRAHVRGATIALVFGSLVRLRSLPATHASRTALPSRNMSATSRASTWSVLRPACCPVAAKL
jgi:hypothetical protein